MKLTTYLNYGGNCREAFQFYEQHLGGKIIFLMTHAEAPGQQTVSQERGNDVLHASLQLGDTSIQGADVPGYQPMRSAYLTLSVDSNEEAERIHALLSDGGEIFMPMQETFFAHRFSMLRDKFGTSWMLIHPRPAPNA